MSLCQDDVTVGGQLKVGVGVVPAIKEGDQKVNGSAFIEGPMVVGSPYRFPTCQAALMVGTLVNPDVDAENPFVPGTLCTGVNNPYAFCVRGDAAIFDNLDVNRTIAAGRDIIAQGEVKSRCGGHILSAKRTLIFLTQLKRDGDFAIHALKVHQMMYIFEEE